MNTTGPLIGALVRPGHYARLVTYDPNRIAELLDAPSLIWRDTKLPPLVLAIPSLPQGHAVNPAARHMAGVDVYGPVLVAGWRGRYGYHSLTRAELRWLDTMVGITPGEVAA